ncbi:MAG: hypothetical protein ABIA74_01915, partial [bacterium]
MTKEKKKKNLFSSLWFKLTLSFFLFLIIFFVVLFLIPVPEVSDCFKTISKVEAYASTIPEFPAPDNTNLVKPDYTSFYKSRVPGLKDKIKFLFGFGKYQFAAKSFKALLDYESNTREKDGLKGNFIYKFPVKDEMKCVIWGDVQGAFHSLVRDLVKLKELEILNDDFSLKDEKYFAVFMGDAISRSAYSMETLGIILRLMKNNPGKVFYLCGTHESNKYWEQHSLKLELDQRAQNYKTIIEDVNKFFNTLPLALYLVQNDQFVRISPWSYDDETNELVQENLYSDFLLKPGQNLETNFITKDNVGGKEVELKVIIKAQKKRQAFQVMDGLRLLPPEKGATSWTLLGAPTLSYIKLFKYIHDSFCIIDIGKRINSWIITKYSRDIIKKGNFYSQKYSFLTGKELTEEQAQELQKLSPEELKVREKDLDKDKKIVKEEKAK